MNVEEIQSYIRELEQSKEVRFSRLVSICTEVFGPPRQRGSHRIFKTTWRGDPRINLQASGKSAKRYQVKQVLQALRRIVGEASSK